MKISLIHPSRGRADKALETYLFWINRSSRHYQIEHLISIDLDDTPDNRIKYRDYFPDSKCVIGDNSGVVEATNRAAKHATGDIMVYLSDDFEAPQNWDEEIVSRISINDKWLLRVNDGHQPFENLVLTIPIMSRALFQMLTYFFHPAYRSMWCDADLYCVCKDYIVNAPDLLFPHKQGPEDETYRRSNLNFEKGREIFFERQKEFGWPRIFNKPRL